MQEPETSRMPGYQRAFLRKEAHHLTPVVTIGQSGLSPAVEKALEEGLYHHELMKIRFQDCKEERHDMANWIARQYQAELVAVVGNTAIFFRQAQDPDARRYRLPVREEGRNRPGRGKRGS